MARAAVFLDRDGTINRELAFLCDPARLVLESGAAQALARLQTAGFLLIVVSNQSGVARGLFDEEAVRRVNAALASMLLEKKVTIDRFYYCPHHPEGAVPAYSFKCRCRKPEPGMILQAAAENDIDLPRSYTVGDSARDLQAGKAAGVSSVLVMTGFGQTALDEVAQKRLADYVAADLADAAAWIVRDAGKKDERIVNC